MSKSKDIHDPKSVTEFIQKLEPEFSKLIEEIRVAVLETDKSVSEQIKWNSPSFFYNGEIKSFNPNEYKRDILVIHTRKNEALLVFPTGNVMDNKSGILEGDYADGRKMINFKTIEDFERKRNDFKEIIKDWLTKVEK
ncbi:MAG: hypothetical protein CFE23_02080 [Flavobacterium sp. BFFFF1]|uniref:DUF1801 domain-containing protein n=1 Tax=Flavobacterium sp. BFFFF1 TaxID=2015557 RepID=UPI000BC4DE78|nr:DUF1801 domain-containing protein [Flavobacterium sp. BFFFF1]OYU82105.1 MAG: hypothetical protein CFE23_02080 [Flavobacterium sp. BFFFF1]